ncbi:MAG: L-aspartate oxidase [Candidatus Melainabacteria bacterium]|nr:L-aspartate oxidase [Candidatus Melainabacteria bacterium]
MRFKARANFDVVIIGSGISGLLCALELAKEKKTVCVLTKEAVTESSSLYAQGGVAVPVGQCDSVEKHLTDTLQAGCGLCDAAVAREIISNSISAFEKLISYGVKFDPDTNNLIHQTKEAAHSVPRVCHIGGDASGRFITKALIDKTCREQNISISQGSIALKILKNEDRACGVLVEDITRNKYVLLGKEIIIATGGTGQIYKFTTNPKVSTGDGIVMASNAGAELQDIEMIQFHPTVLLKGQEALLITEAIRGEGAKLKNSHGEPFADKYHKLGELAPRDVLARAILHEMKKANSEHVFLDVSNFNEEYFKNRFPTIYQFCKDRKINLFRTGIPVSPGAHYLVGGIKCNISGKTSVPGLWVTGESASNGFHGANRLASNSLLECIVTPHFLVKEMLEKILVNYPTLNNSYDIDIDNNQYHENDIKALLLDLQFKNWDNIGLIRTGKNLINHLNWLEGISEWFNLDVLSDHYQLQELKNMILLSKIICQAAIERKHSLGVHFREDYPQVPQEIRHSLFKVNVKEKMPVSFL